MNHSRLSLSSLALMAMVATSGQCLAQRLPDPPPQQAPSVTFRVPNMLQFVEAYKRAGSPRLLITTEVVGFVDTTGAALNAQGMAARLNNRVQDAFRHPEVFIASGGASSVKREADLSNSLAQDDFTVARVMGQQVNADIVMYIRLIEQSNRADRVRYTATYTIADLRRGQSLGSFSWDMYEDPNSGEFDARRMADYAEVISSRMSFDFSDSFPTAGELSGQRAFTIRMLSDERDLDLRSLRNALQAIEGMKAGSVRLTREDSIDTQRLLVFDLSFSGDLIDLRSEVLDATRIQLGMNASITGANEGTITIRLSPGTPRTQPAPLVPAAPVTPVAPVTPATPTNPASPQPPQ